MRAALPYTGCPENGRRFCKLLRLGTDPSDSHPDGLFQFPYRKTLLSDFDSGKRVSLLYQKKKDCFYR